MKGWIARDKDWMLHFFFTKPTRYEDLGVWASGGERYLIPGEFGNNLYWNDKPIEVELLVNKL